MDDGTGHDTTIEQSSLNSAFELNQSYNSGL